MGGRNGRAHIDRKTERGMKDIQNRLRAQQEMYLHFSPKRATFRASYGVTPLSSNPLRFDRRPTEALILKWRKLVWRTTDNSQSLKDRE